MIGSIIASIVLSILDGIFKGGVYLGAYSLSYVMVTTWIADFRFLAGQAVYAATIFIVGAKFIETRSIFTVGFDKLDVAKMTLKGPDDDNVVWIGHRYGTQLEAEAVAAAFAERLKQNAAA